MNITPVSVDNFRSKLVSNTDMIDTATRPETASFEQTLLAAFDKMNEKQQTTDTLANPPAQSGKRQDFRVRRGSDFRH